MGGGGENGAGSEGWRQRMPQTPNRGSNIESCRENLY